ncbi:uncharacterized protein LOC126379692 [Pectinophora gossypiella]|uniref:uncharacterized protein LOC126379692 n=1 Tax=Pectinophora gossypiella TaxID=13191 RepID=UPI00214E27AA|nr:uncharacterized protein LOC126379692 [Pectinophora gossypiella]
MKRQEYPEDYDPDAPRSRASSRRNSASSRRNSVKKEREGKKKSPLNTAPSSTNSTPKKQIKPPTLDFCVTGKQLLKNWGAYEKTNYFDLPNLSTLGLKYEDIDELTTVKAYFSAMEGHTKAVTNADIKEIYLNEYIVKCFLFLFFVCCFFVNRSDRANSLPVYQRRPSADLKRKDTSKAGPGSRDTSLEDETSLDLSQVSDFEDTNSKYGVQRKSSPLATSTPKVTPRTVQKGRSGSLQNQLLQKMETRRAQKTDSRQSISNFSCSRDSLYKTSSSTSYKYGASTELDYSSVSPEYSGQSSTELSPRNFRDAEMTISPRSQELHVSSCCVSTWQDCSENETKVEEYRRAENGEWNHFWANYNNSVSKVPMKSYYDQCPTPYRTENIDLADLGDVPMQCPTPFRTENVDFADIDFSAAGSRKRSPDNARNLNNIIRNEGLHLTPRETQNIIKCAHILGNVLTKAIERRSKEKDQDEDKIQELAVNNDPQPDEKEIKKKTLTLDLKETAIPLEVKEEKRSETVTTQTDISLPNTKSAPRIFEKILRQLSKTSLEESLEKKDKEEKTENKEEGKIEQNETDNK